MDGIGARDGVAAGMSREPGDAHARRAVRWTLAAYAAVSVLFSGAFPPYGKPNEVSR
jgi:hypothetical protein